MPRCFPVGIQEDMTEVFIRGHFSTNFNSHGVDQESAFHQEMYLFTRLTGEGIDPTARVVKPTFAAIAQKQVAVYQKESFTAQSCYISFLHVWKFCTTSCHLHLQACKCCVYIPCWSLRSQNEKGREKKQDISPAFIFF